MVVGGTQDHVHILMDIGKMKTPVELVAEIKKESSKFVKTLGCQYHDFYWQRGYGLFSVGVLQREQVEDYVRNQQKHHRTMTFQEEYVAFLERYNVDYDERYLWD